MLSIAAACLAFAPAVEPEPPAPTQDPLCACTGNMGKAALQDYYPEDIGNDCSAWDGGMDYCLEGGSSYGESWCPTPWCYAPESCEGSAKGTYLADVEGPELYYNYDLCGAEDTYTGTDSDPLKVEASPPPSPSLPCVDAEGTLEFLTEFFPYTYWTSCADVGADYAWDYEAAIAAGSYDTAGGSFDGFAECSVSDTRYITSCDGMPAAFGTLAEGYYQCEPGGYYFNDAVGLQFGAGYQSYVPATTSDPDGVNYMLGDVSHVVHDDVVHDVDTLSGTPATTGGMNLIRELCPLSCGACP